MAKKTSNTQNTHNEESGSGSDGISFSKKYERFESIIQELENDELTIEDQIKKIEEGTKLYKECVKYLNNTKNKITLINKELEKVDLDSDLDIDQDLDN